MFIQNLLRILIGQGCRSQSILTFLVPGQNSAPALLLQNMLFYFRTCYSTSEHAILLQNMLFLPEHKKICLCIFSQEPPLYLENLIHPPSFWKPFLTVFHFPLQLAPIMGNFSPLRSLGTKDYAMHTIYLPHF